MKTLSGSTLYCLVSTLLMLGFVDHVAANTVTHLANKQSALIRDDSAGNEPRDNDILMVNAPNAQGVSVNHYHQFSIDKPLNIINLGKNDTRLAADVIVIQAPLIAIKDQITFVGPKADVIFVGTGAGASVQCKPCDMRNTLRTVLAAATPVTLLSGEVATLSTRQNAAIEYSGIEAPGALALELISDNLVPVGDAIINTMEKTARHANGGYVSDENGRLLMGGGGVNFNLGYLNWDFQTQGITAFLGPEPQGAESIISGQISSTVVNVTSGRPLNVAANINTRSDLASSHRYQNKMIVHDEQVRFTTLFKDTHNIRVYGAINSDGKLLINSAGWLNFHRQGQPYPTFRVGTLTAMAKKDIVNRASVFANTIQMAGQSLTNHRNLQGLSTIELFAEQNIINHSIIRADNITLESASGTVLNGFRSNNPDTGMKPLQLDVKQYQMGDIARRGLIFNPAINQSASIRSIHNISSVIARNLYIKTRNLENINPYYGKDSDGDGIVDLDIKHFDQVHLSAENNLYISATGYIMNASAIIEQNSPDGETKIKAPIFVNDRYLIYSGLEKRKSDSNTNTSSTTVNTITTETTLYSPPGRVVSFGHAYIAATQGIINNSSYIEGFQNMDLYTTANLLDIGIKHQTINQQTSVDYAAAVSCEKNKLAKRLHTESRLCDDNDDYTDQSIVTEDLAVLDSLLFIQGNTRGKEALFLPLTLLPWEYYQTEAIKLKQSELFASQFTSGSQKRRFVHKIENTNVRITAYETVNKGEWEKQDCSDTLSPIGPNGEPINGGKPIEECRQHFVTRPVEVQVGQPKVEAIYPMMLEYYESQRATHNALLQRIQ